MRYRVSMRGSIRPFVCLGRRTFSATGARLVPHRIWALWLLLPVDDGKSKTGCSHFELPLLFHLYLLLALPFFLMGEGAKRH